MEFDLVFVFVYWMNWSCGLVICFSAYSYDEIEEKAKALRQSASYNVTDDVSGFGVSATMCLILNLRNLAIYNVICLSIVFLFKLYSCFFSFPMHSLKPD